MDPVNRSLINLHVTVMILGGTALFSKLIPLSALDITFGRSLIACICLICIVYISGQKMALDNKKDYFIGVSLGVIMAAHWVTYFMSMQYASVSVGIIALFTFPVITVLLEPLFEKMRLAWQDVVSALVVLLGIYLIVPSTSLQDEVTLGVVIGVFSAFLYALRNLIHRKHFSKYSGVKAMAWQTMVVCPCVIWFVSDEVLAFDISLHTALLLLLLGSVFTALPHSLIASTLKHLRAKTFALVSCMQPLYGVVFAMIILKEAPSWQTFIGGALVISAALYETVKTHRERKSQ